nr:uncharacterized protein LOC108057330 isoform X2 [Drosophila takahashii]
MTNISIIDLNDDCLYSIFEEIKKNCENDIRGIPDMVAFWDTVFILLEDNSRLTQCFLKYNPPLQFYCPDHMEIFENTMRILKKKRGLTTLVLQMPSYSAGNLEHFHNLRSLSLYVAMSAYDLMECVKSNPNLIELAFHSTNMYGNLADITPYCSNLEIVDHSNETGNECQRIRTTGQIAETKDI